MSVLPTSSSTATSRFSDGVDDSPSPNYRTSKVVTSATRRSAGFDAARLAAAFAIALCHSVQIPLLQHIFGPGLMGTSFFAAAAMYFLVRGLRKDPDRSYPRYARARFQRLILPFVGWNICYFLMRVVCDHWIERRPIIPMTPAMFLLGYENKLWFLPFIFIASLLAFPIARYGLRWASLRTAIVILCIAIGVTFCLLPPPETYLPDTALFIFLQRIFRILPCTVWGIAIGLSQDAEAERRWASNQMPVIACAAIILSVLLGWTWGVTVVVRNLGGLGLLVLGLSLPNANVPAVVRKYAPKSFGIYLIHPLMIGVWVIVLRRIGLHHNIATELLTYIPIIVSTIALLTLVQGSRWTRWLIPDGTASSASHVTATPRPVLTIFPVTPKRTFKAPIVFSRQ
jgi:fucose 4-O-acetylase-like acetyltransferase